MKKRKKSIYLIIVSCVLIYVAVMVLGSTFSWFTGNDTMANSFTSPEQIFSVKVVDVFAPPSDFKPGDCVQKKVGASNENEMPAFVRIMVQPTIISKEGQPLESQIGKQLELVGLNTEKWVYGNDGYYYYLEVLGPKGSGTDISELLFTGVKLSDSVDDSYKDATMDIAVKTEAIDTKKWSYRTAWWNNEEKQTNEPLKKIDEALSVKVG